MRLDRIKRNNSEYIKENGMLRIHFGDSLLRLLGEWATQEKDKAPHSQCHVLQLSHIDLDGYGSVGMTEVFLNTFKLKMTRLTNCGYTNVIKNFNNTLDYKSPRQNPDMRYIYFITDMSFDANCWDELINKANMYKNVEFVYIDHHLSSMRGLVDSFYIGTNGGDNKAITDVLPPNLHIALMMDDAVEPMCATEMYAELLLLADLDTKHFTYNLFSIGVLGKLISVWDTQQNTSTLYELSSSLNQAIRFFNDISKSNNAMKTAMNMLFSSDYESTYPGEFYRASFHSRLLGLNAMTLKGWEIVAHDVINAMVSTITADDVLAIETGKVELIYKKVKEYICEFNKQSEMGNPHGMFIDIPQVKQMCCVMMDENPDVGAEEILILPSLEGCMTSISQLLFKETAYKIIIEVQLLGGEITFNLRGKKDCGANVRKAAEVLGGGGHDLAAGCKIKYTV